MVTKDETSGVDAQGSKTWSLRLEWVMDDITTHRRHRYLFNATAETSLQTLVPVHPELVIGPGQMNRCTYPYFTPALSSSCLCGSGRGMIGVDRLFLFFDVPASCLEAETIVFPVPRLPQSLVRSL
jgi:hypothetical protein